ncbi:hypothetical protein [Streptomyces sp. NPDC005438]|uniref:hypothetical protein n=1 Tax=Streptomyces sp. NPDC005438 TaxID=3156880 RepID=UPI00339F5D8F
MRHTKMLVGLVAVGVLATGCGSGDSSSESKPAHADARDAENAENAENDTKESPQAAMPVAITGPQSDVLTSSTDDKLKVRPEPPNTAPFTDRVEHKLREQVLSSVKVPGKTSADCPDGVTQKAGAVSTCNVTYEGAVVPYEVKISDSYKEGSFMTFYNTKPLKGLVVAKAVYQTLYKQYGPESGRSDASKLACQKLPAAKAVALQTDSGLRCQYWSKYAGQGKGGYETLSVKAGSYGPTLEQMR